jgi:hypothetical protein
MLNSFQEILAVPSPKVFGFNRNYARLFDFLLRVFEGNKVDFK